MALDYDEGEAGALRRARDRIVVSAARGVPGRTDCITNLASYLEDAVAFEDASLFSSHVAWAARWMERTQGGGLPLVRDLQALEAAITAEPPLPRALQMLRDGYQATAPGRES